MHATRSNARGTDETGLGLGVALTSAFLLTVVGVLYVVVLGIALLRGAFAFPPPEWLQLFGGVTSMIECPLLVMLVAAMGALSSRDRRVLATIALAFTTLFALAVSINRFSQLGVVRQSAGLTTVPGIEWFLAYGTNSIMLGLEYLGWGWFLGMGMFFTAGILGKGPRERAVRVLAIVYGALGLTASIGFLMPSALSLVGFAAWGLVLPAVTLLLTIELWIRKAKLKENPKPVE